jgi:REP element-mobilizing transposase RayT
MHIISRDSPCYYLTSVTRARLSVFRSDELKLITCAALDEARRSGGFALYAYVIMPNHLHLITDHSLTPSRTLQFINGITSRRIIGYLKEHNYADLAKQAEEYRWSSIRCWAGNILDDEPLLMNIDRIRWRSGGVAS